MKSTTLGHSSVRPLLLRFGLVAIGACVQMVTFYQSAQADKGQYGGRPVEVIYRTVAGDSLKLDAYLHSGRANHPAVVYVHGGGFVTGDKSPCPSYILSPYLHNGFSVFSVNYRLAPQHPYPAAIDDVTSAIRFIKEHSQEWNIDPDRMVLTGESAGGLISALVGATLRGPDRVAAVVPLFGETDLELRISENPCCMDGTAVARPQGGCISAGLAAFLGFKEVSNEAQRDVVRKASTITYVKQGMPPYLLIHGTRDFGVPFEQSVSLQQALERCGADCTLIPIVGGGHGNWTPEQWADVESKTFDWLAQRLPY